MSTGAPLGGVGANGTTRPPRTSPAYLGSTERPRARQYARTRARAGSACPKSVKKSWEKTGYRVV